ncbi:hypothetical protein [Paenibacillus larvae]|uniref:hypothetical protein n=1 Tax=Paenibacillus larvae TaxID=1464 RepID=UPI0004202EF4|nr:hypothetical protein [Paenibacillus larvae]
MPTSKKESIQFGLMMCFGMVLVMTIYNLLLNGVNGSITIPKVIGEFMIKSKFVCKFPQLDCAT